MLHRTIHSQIDGRRLGALVTSTEDLGPACWGVLLDRLGVPEAPGSAPVMSEERGFPGIVQSLDAVKPPRDAGFGRWTNSETLC